MCNDDAKKVSNLEMGCCKKMTRGEMRMMNQKQKTRMMVKQKNTKRSDDLLKSNMK